MKKNFLFTLAVLLVSTNIAYAASPACNQYEVGFSPEGSAQDLVIKTIRSAQREVKVMAYSFTSKTVVRELLYAKRRGATIQVIADSSNLSSKAGNAALSALANAGADIRTIDTYKITHDKVIIVDALHVEFGSFNYSMAAAKDNSENANACFNSPQVAAQYAAHWQSRWNQGRAFQPRY